MTRQLWIIIMLLGVGLLMGGCAETLTITYRSTPPGAGVYSNNDNQERGYAPVTLEYEVSGSDRKRGYMFVDGIHVRWASGATARTPSLRVDLSLGDNQEFTFIRPKDVPGELEDFQFARELQEIYARHRQQVQAEAHENAQILLGVLRGFNAGMQNRSTSRQPPTNALQGALRGFNDGLQKSSAQSSDRWMDEGGGDRRNMRTGELEMNMGGGGSLNTTTGELRHGAGGGDTIGSDGQYRQDGQDEDGNYTADFLD